MLAIEGQARKSVSNLEERTISFTTPTITEAAEPEAEGEHEVCDISFARSSAHTSPSASHKDGSTQPQVFSALYIQSLKELHQAELETLRMKQHYAMENMRKEFEVKLSEKVGEIEVKNDVKGILAEYEGEMIEMHEIIRNLQAQNALLREENQILKETDRQREQEMEEYKRDVEDRLGEMKVQFQKELQKMKYQPVQQQAQPPQSRKYSPRVHDYGYSLHY